MTTTFDSLIAVLDAAVSNLETLRAGLSALEPATVPAPVAAASAAVASITLAPASALLLTPTSGGVITDASGNVWTLSSTGVVSQNGKPVGGGSGTGALAYENDIIYGQDAATSEWYNYGAGFWIGPVAVPAGVGSASSPPVVPVSSPVVTSAPGLTLAQRLLALLVSLKGKGCISGQFTQFGDMTAIDAIATLSGKKLGLLGGDYWYPGAPLSGGANYASNTAAIAHAAQGGINTLCFSMPNPTTGGPEQDLGVNWNDVLTPGTASYANLNTILDQMANGLLQLEQAGVPVLLRIYHEQDGGWFWWGNSSGTVTQFIALWQYTVDYLISTKGLTNLVPLFATNGSSTSRYPGDAYVGAVGWDMYTDNPASGASAYQALQAFGKPIILAEFGSGGPGGGDTTFAMTTLVSALKTELSDVVAEQHWWDGNNNNPGWGMGEETAVTAALADPWMLNIGDFSL